MTKEMDFFIFLIEQYANNKNTTANKILQKWDQLGLTDFIISMYERYHSEALENAFADIDQMMEDSAMENHVV